MVWWWLAGSWFTLAVGVSLVVVRGIKLADRRSAGSGTDAVAGPPAVPARRLLRAEEHLPVAPRSWPGSHRQRARSPMVAGTARGEQPLVP